MLLRHHYFFKMIIKKHDLFRLEDIITLVYKMMTEEFMILVNYVYENMSRQQLEIILTTPSAPRTHT